MGLCLAGQGRRASRRSPRKVQLVAEGKTRRRQPHRVCHMAKMISTHPSEGACVDGTPVTRSTKPVLQAVQESLYFYLFVKYNCLMYTESGEMYNKFRTGYRLI